MQENTNFKIIQSLLGQHNSKKTEVYTDVSTKIFDQLKFPIDNLVF